MDLGNRVRCPLDTCEQWVRNYRNCDTLQMVSHKEQTLRLTWQFLGQVLLNRSTTFVVATTDNSVRPNWFRIAVMIEFVARRKDRLKPITVIAIVMNIQFNHASKTSSICAAISSGEWLSVCRITFGATVAGSKNTTLSFTIRRSISSGERP